MRLKKKCHRSGEFRSRGTKSRKLKIQGSNKIGGYCPALISTVLKNNGCVVRYCKTHLGHGQDLGHLFLFEWQRQNIATKIAANIENRKDKDKWFNAVARELKSIEDNNTWKEVEEPKDINILDTKWVFTHKILEDKEEDKYKNNHGNYQTTDGTKVTTYACHRSGFYKGTVPQL
ncbi:uncharacterized protein LOC126744206 [Anthonomus grandis grandis]|uniref:uncharacterized protein LOC126744206 n=1 Tax=Anthonomus grandis grandis TaxID=2921223 RepID=UPI002165F1F1|nr:uncharacterized protein LOC126744206 [Anthonomus grandis grandis]